MYLAPPWCILWCMKRTLLGIVSLLALSACGGGGDGLADEERAAIQEIESLEASLDADFEKALAEETATPDTGVPPFLKFGQSVVFPNGAEVTVEPPEEFTPDWSQWPAEGPTGEPVPKTDTFLAFKVIAENTSRGVLKPGAWTDDYIGASVYSAGVESQLEGYGNFEYDLGPLEPPSRLMPGASATWIEVANVADPSDVALVVSTGPLSEWETTYMTKVPTG